MPVDVAAEVMANRRLSADYNVLALRGAGDRPRAEPGQFVMVKAGLGLRPAAAPALFRVRRSFATAGDAYRPVAAEQTHRSIDRSRVQREPGQRVACLGPLGRPFSLVDPPTEAWMVAGGVGLAPFVTLAESLRARGVGCTLFYGARRAEELFCLDLFSGSRRRSRAHDRRRQRGRARPRHRPPRAASRVRARQAAGDDLRMRPGRHAGRHREDCDAPRAPVPGVGRARHGMRAGRLLQLRRAHAQRAGRFPPRPIVPQRARCSRQIR